VRQAGSGGREDCPAFSPGEKTGVVAPVLEEVSGLLVGRRNPDILWAHNDSGDRARLYALERSGRLRATYELKGVEAVDWEDMAWGAPQGQPGAAFGELLLGDIGDNFRWRRSVEIYGIEEPLVPLEATAAVRSIDRHKKTLLQYDNGPRDAEALFLDPISGQLVVIEKVSRGQTPSVFAAGSPTAGRATLTRVGDLNPGPASLRDISLITAADISRDGLQILVRSYTRALLYLRAANESLAKALSSSPCAVPLRDEPQGEAICFDEGRDAYVTTSEHGSQPLFSFEKRAKH